MEIDSPSAVSEEYDEMSDPCVHDGSIPVVDTTPDAGSMEADWIDEERRDDEELQINIAGLTMETDEDLNDEVDLIAPIVWSDQSISAEYILEILRNMKAREVSGEILDEVQRKKMASFFFFFILSSSSLNRKRYRLFMSFSFI